MAAAVTARMHACMHPPARQRRRSPASRRALAGPGLGQTIPQVARLAQRKAARRIAWPKNAFVMAPGPDSAARRRCSGRGAPLGASRRRASARVSERAFAPAGSARAAGEEGRAVEWARRGPGGFSEWAKWGQQHLLTTRQQELLTSGAHIRCPTIKMQFH